ncbi:Adenine deaminase [Actinomadura rubteroloni]|uniref:Adenine deaminase n=1 Tax=Actinomadura rubteroloni TaxID=1926885 RepID=A0A2P4UBR0_9ACTN|nr:adenosine deaminase [Actinomadura rubteroloni]POM22468.1 Adenine deaminase [Actinomadura rubteroloni]
MTVPVPKAELHLHIEGTLEPEAALACAARNGVELPFASADALRAAYSFTDLASFLDLYYALMAVLRTERDFTELADAYLARAAAQGVRHAEIFFDPQAHLARGVALATVLDGLGAALAAAPARHGITTRLIMCFLRDRPAAEALEVFEAARPWFGTLVTGVGLDSAEVGNPPAPFAEVFGRARDAGLRRVAHAGEEGPPAYVREVLDVLGAERVDHGIRSLEDPELVARLVRERVPLTVCPLSNVRLRCVPDLAAHPLPRMLDAGLLVTVNSDDPSYFGGYIEDNYAALGLDDETSRLLAANSFRAAFLPEDERAAHLRAVAAHRFG